MPTSGPSANEAIPSAPSIVGVKHWPIVLAGSLIALGVLAAYHNCFFTPFVFDDFPVIVENPTIRRLWPIGDALSPPRASGMTVSGRPLVNLSLAVNYALGGAAVGGYHALNVMIHIMAGWTLFGIVRRTLLRPRLRERFGAAALPLATAVAVLWTVHPLLTESVTYVAQRAESLMALFYLLTLYGFIRGTESAKSGVWYGLCVGACLLGMATKEVMVSAPLIIFLYDRTFVEGTFQRAWKRHWRLYVGLAGTWLVLGYLVISTGNRAGTAGLGTHVRMWEYALTQCWAVTQYLWLSIWPHPLVFDYGMWLARDAAEVVPRALILAGVLTAVVVGLRFNPAIGFLGAWFFLILAPTSSFVPVVSQTVAEHRMYLPLAALVALTVTGLHIWIGRRSLAVFVVLAVVLGFLTSRRNFDYRSAVAIWGDTVSKRPGSLRAHYSLGFALEQAGKIEEAIGQYEQVVWLDPDYAEAHDRLGNDLIQVGKLSDAIGHFEQALRIKPEYSKAHNDLGVALERAGRIPEAITHYEQALRLNPHYADPHYNLGIALERSGRVREAIVCYEQALQLDPNFAEAHNNLGGALAGQGRVQEALEHWNLALRVKPDFAEAHNNLGSALLGLGKVPEAIEQYEQALRIKPDYAMAHYNLGIALEEAGRVREAIGHYEQSVRLAPDFSEAQKRLVRLRTVQ
jgi:tetratricopeptide (TPR) repeat protein